MALLAAMGLTSVLLGHVATAATPDGAAGVAAETRDTAAQGLPRSFLTGPRPGRPLPNALAFFRSRGPHLGLTARDLAGFRVSSSFTDGYNGVTHVYLQQRFRRIDVLGAVASVNVARDGSIINLHSAFVSRLAERVNRLTPTTSPAQGFAATLKALGLHPRTPIRTLQRPSGLSRQATLSGAGVATGPVPTQLVYVPVRSGAVRLAWNSQIDQRNGAHWWDAAVDAVTSTLLNKTDWTDHADDSYNVYAPPLESPQSGSRSIVTAPADPLASPYGWLDNNGQPGADITITNGNNVEAYTDTDNDNAPDPGSEADAGPSLSFNFPLNLSQDPSTYRPAAVTNLFFWNNYLHDVSFHYGFDEAAGNFQKADYTGKGAGLDDVKAEAQDGGGINNSNFSTPPDGQSPRMQMYVWQPPPAPPVVTISAPAGIATDMAAGRAAYGPVTADTGISGPLRLAPDATLCTDVSGTYGSTYLQGATAVVDRGTCSFKRKSLDAQLLGAQAVIIVNNQPSGLFNIGDDPAVTTTITIPTVGISLSDGNAIKGQLNANVEVDGTVKVPATPPVVDGDFDNGIIAHEYMHGISNRLTGGPANSSCLVNTEQAGEGWSDFLALAMTASPGDVETTARPVGSYVTGGVGTRRTPYSADMSVDPATYDSLKQYTAQDPHDVGYVWASMLWDMYWQLVDAHGFTPIQQHDLTSGNGLALQLVMDGLKFQPCNPGFVDSRDAILQADQVDTGGQNQCLIWRTFARRGLGAGASEGDPNLIDDGTASFDVPAACAPTIGFTTSPATATGGGGLWFNAHDLGPSGTLGVTVETAPPAQSAGVRSVSCSLDGTPLPGGLGGTITLSGLGDGVHTLSCTAIDVDGDQTPTAATATFRVDTHAPTVKPSVTHGATVLLGTPIKGRASDSTSKVASSRCRPGTASAIGQRLTFSCTATDGAGNSRTVRVTGVTVSAKFGAFASPRSHSVLPRTAATLPVTFSLRNNKGTISGRAARTLATNGQLRVIITGPRGSTTVLSASSTCSYVSAGSRFRCTLELPDHLLAGNAARNINPYTIAVQQRGGRSTSSADFFLVPKGTETVYFR